MPSEWAPAAVSEFGGWNFKWMRLVTSFAFDTDCNSVSSADAEACMTHLVAFSLDGKGTVERELIAADFKALQCGAALDCALASVERGVAALSLVDVKRGAAQQLKAKTAEIAKLKAELASIHHAPNAWPQNDK